MGSISDLRPRWWRPELEEALQVHLASGGSIGYKSLGKNLRLREIDARVLSAILSRPEWLTDEILEAASHASSPYRLAQMFDLGPVRARIAVEYAKALKRRRHAHEGATEQTATLFIPEDQGVPSPEQIIELLKIDPAVWEIVSVNVDKGEWDIGRKNARTNLRFEGRDIYGTKQDEGDFNVRPLRRYRLTVRLRPRKQLLEFKEAVAKIVEEARAHAPKYPSVDRPPPPPSGAHLFLVGLYDLHLGKLAWAPETGQNYDLAIAQKLALEAVEGLVARVKGYGHVEKVLLPLGGDILHIDNAQGTTTAGTPQDYDGRWQKVFTTAHKLIVQIVDRLLDLAPVRIVVIPGNHDATVSYFLGEVLAAWYRNTGDVEVDNEPGVRKFYRWRSVLFWFYHGHRGKPADWFADIANHAGPAWHECRFKEGILGHIHHEFFRDYKGVIFRNLRSLSAVDAWHAQNFYNGNIRGLMGILYHEEVGPYAPIPYYVWEKGGA